MHGPTGALTPCATPRRMAVAALLAVTALLLLPFAAGAQSITEDANTGPRVGALQVGVQAGVQVGDPLAVRVVDLAEARSATSTSPALQPPVTRRRGVPQMIIGGAALVGGAIIGGDAGTLVMLGGLGYGLYGLYLYLQ